MKRRKAFTVFSNNKIIILIVLVAIIVLGFLLSSFLLQTQEVKFSFKAAIIDQLGKDFPNSKFKETVIRLLENAGFNVSYHRSEDITVKFYKGLAKYNYGLIILRTHSALREGETIVDLFTSELFREDKYVSEQDNGLLTRGNYSWKPGKFYFAITPEFIENLEGYFPKSIVIAMGCWSLKPECEEMAGAFIKKGAKVYIGWNDAISMQHADNSTVRLLRYLTNNNMTIDDAISECNKFHDSELMYYYSKLSFYPHTSEIGEYKLGDIVSNASLLNTFHFVAQTCLASKKKTPTSRLVLYMEHHRNN